MSEQFTQAARDLFAKKSLLHVASLGPDGSPHVTPVWGEPTAMTSSSTPP